MTLLKPADRGFHTGYSRDFQLFLSGQIVSVIGDRVALIALVFLIIHLSHSYPPALALFYICRAVPDLAVGLIVGVFVDHFDRRRLMIGADVGRVVLMGVVPAAVGLGLWLLFPIVGLLYLLTLVFDTASTAALPDVVHEDRMLAANALLNGIRTSADFAYALGGVLILTLKFQAPFYIDGATFAFSAIMIARMHIPTGRRGPLPDITGVLRGIRRGLDYLWAQPFLKWSTVASILGPLAGGMAYVINPLYATHALAHSKGLVGPLHSGAFRFSLLEVCVGLGGVCGSILVSRMVEKIPRGKLFGLGLFGMGIAVAPLYAISNVYAAGALLFASGAANSIFVISGLTLVQLLTPSEMRGRVVAARTTVISSSIAIGSLLAGFLLLAVSYSEMWLVIAALLVGSSFFVWLRPLVRDQP
jgi:MFS family permease